LTELTPAEKAALQALKTSPNDFDCLPLRHQVEYFVRYLKDRGDASFTVDDLRVLFATADMIAPRSRKPLRPTPGQLQKALDLLQRSGALVIRQSVDTYEAI
jgi:hypothetical protein